MSVTCIGIGDPRAELGKHCRRLTVPSAACRRHVPWVCPIDSYRGRVYRPGSVCQVRPAMVLLCQATLRSPRANWLPGSDRSANCLRPEVDARRAKVDHFHNPPVTDRVATDEVKICIGIEVKPATADWLFPCGAGYCSRADGVRTRINALCK